MILREGTIAENVTPRYKTGKEHHSWKKERSIEDRIKKRQDKSVELTKWRKAIFERDSYKCQKCFEKGKYIEAHHILNWIDNYDLRFEITNGITLCTEHHYEFHVIYGRTNNSQLQLDVYLNSESLEKHIQELAAKSDLKVPELW